MASTSRVNIVAGQWVLLADGKANVLVQRLTTGLLEVEVAAAAPANNAVDLGHVLWEGEPSASFVGLATTDKVYVRAAPGQTGTVVVTA